MTNVDRKILNIKSNSKENGNQRLFRMFRREILFRLL